MFHLFVKYCQFSFRLYSLSFLFISSTIPYIFFFFIYILSVFLNDLLLFFFLCSALLYLFFVVSISYVLYLFSEYFWIYSNYGYQDDYTAWSVYFFAYLYFFMYLLSYSGNCLSIYVFFITFQFITLSLLSICIFVCLSISH